MKYICPVCGYDGLEEAPYDKNNCASYEICRCCGFEYGFHDFSKGETFESYREKWLSNGAVWRIPSYKPTDWDIEEQFKNLEISE